MGPRDCAQGDLEPMTDWAEKWELIFRRGKTYRQFRRFPPAAFEDKRLNSSHIDVLVALSFFHDIRNGVFVQYYSVRPAHIAEFTSYQERFVRRVLVELEGFGIVEMEREQNKIVAVRWAQPYTDALRNRAKFIRVPMPVIHDTYLTPKQRHGYLAFLSHEYWTRIATSRRGSDPFFLSNSILMQKMRCNKKTARKVRQDLVDLKLLAYHDTMPDHRGMRAMVFVPMNLRYIAIDSARGERTFLPKFLPFTVIEEGNPGLWGFERAWRHWAEDGQPSFVDTEYEGFRSSLPTAAYKEELDWKMDLYDEELEAAQGVQGISPA